MGLFVRALNFLPISPNLYLSGLTAMGNFPGFVALSYSEFPSKCNILVYSVPELKPLYAFTTEFAYSAGTGAPIRAIKFFDATHLVAFDLNGKGFYIDLTGPSITLLGTGLFYPFPSGIGAQTKSQRLAVDLVGGEALAFQQSPSKLTKVTALGVASTITLSAPPYLGMDCIIYDPVTLSYYAGASDSHIYAFDSTGTVSSTVALNALTPSQPSFSSFSPPDTPNMSACSLLALNSSLFIGTYQGATLRCPTGSATLTRRWWHGNGSQLPCTMFSNPVNGLVLQSFEYAFSGGGAYCTIHDYSQLPEMELDELSLELPTTVSGIVVDLCLDSTGYGLIGLSFGLLVYQIDGLVNSTVDTRYIDSGGSDIPDRIIRTINPRNYRARVELDTAELAGLISEPARCQNINYTEIGLAGSDADMRRFP